MTVIAIVGEHLPDFPPHVATDAAIAHSAEALGVKVDARWIATDEELPPVDAIWCAPGSPYRSLDGALAALRHGREHGVPTLGTCGGCQHMLLEFGRNVLGVADAQHAEYDPYASRLFVTPLTCEVAGRTMHVTLDPASRLYGGETDVQEQYYCNFRPEPGVPRAARRSRLPDHGRGRRRRRPRLRARRPPVLRRDPVRAADALRAGAPASRGHGVRRRRGGRASMSR